MTIFGDNSYLGMYLKVLYPPEPKSTWKIFLELHALGKGPQKIIKNEKTSMFKVILCACNVLVYVVNVHI